MGDSLQSRFSKLSIGRVAKGKQPAAALPRFHLLWQKAHTTAKGERQVVEIPFYATHRIVSLLSFSRDSLGYKPDRTMLKTIFDRLVIFRENASSPFVSKIVRYHPDRPYLEKYNYDVSHLHLYGLGDYTGYLEYLTPTGSRTGIVRVVNGRPVRKYSGKGKSASKRQESRGMSIMSDGYWDCIEICEDIIQTICVGNPEDPDNPEDEICSDDVVGQDCYDDCEWVEEEEPDYCDFPENWEECYGDPEGPEEPEEILLDTLKIAPSNDPCGGKAAVNERLNKDTISSSMDTTRSRMNNNLVNGKKVEYGFETLLTDLSSKEFKVNPVKTSNNPAGVNLDTRWSPLDGYTIGYTHIHPSNSAPSPSDLFFGSQWYSSVPTAEQSIYSSYYTSTVMTDDYIYVITIKNTTRWSGIDLSVQSNRDAANDEYRRLTHEYMKTLGWTNSVESQLSALLEMYGNTVNIYRSPVQNTLDFQPLQLTLGGPIVNPC
ncbi:hypothetical protein G5B00_11380 [Parapedobacter sp. SGR-10]|uniref:hypothetical protein n=1 Tax=Parapedobacter sp. SGR-10 TaxID=2710879 RepID=UPI0013D3470D|nr:hypothetical protein [Parapedobacter sp. SGR-10]NGF57115.1 hypothetical protein [Parapedobacter sp. SGR-10]